MPRLNVTLEARGPLLLGTGLAVGNVQESRSYVAGSVWRGALARTVLQARGQFQHSGRPVTFSAPAADFADVFLGSKAARFGFLYPARAAEGMPIPLTARTCKQKPGFGRFGHGFYDGLLNRLREAADGQRAYTRGEDKECPHCAGRLERRRGFMGRMPGDAADSYHEARPGRRAFVRVGLNRYTETAQEQVLYTLEALTPPAGDENAEASITFVGSWWGTTEQEQILQTWLQEYLLPEDAGYRLDVGTARARGMGHAILRLTSAGEEEDTFREEELAARLKSFQPAADGQPTDPAHLYAALTLRSPLVLVDGRGLPAQRITPDLLRAYNPNMPSGLEVLSDYSVLERETWTGWSAAWGLPKPVTTVISAGSVIALRVPMSQQAQLLDYLATLAGEGLGEHRSEGFGEVLVCDPFHIAFDEG